MNIYFIKIVEGMQQKSPEKFVKKVLPLGSPERRFLEDLIIDYYMWYFNEIYRAWKPESESDLIQFPIRGLELFVGGLHRTVTTSRLTPNQKEFIRQAIEVMQENLVDWYKEFQEDPEFKEALGKSYIWIKTLRHQSRHAPNNHLALASALWGVEAFLKIGDKKII
jgi:hypothetical protein